MVARLVHAAALCYGRCVLLATVSSVIASHHPTAIAGIRLGAVRRRYLEAALYREKVSPGWYVALLFAVFGIFFMLSIVYRVASGHVD